MSRELIYLLTGVNMSRVLCNYRSDTAACLNRAGEYGESAVLNEVGYILNLHAVSRVGLVGAVAFHSFFVCESRKRERDINIKNFFEQTRDVTLVHGHDILFVNERHFEVYLGEFGLTVCSEVLVAEASCKLDISVKSG